MGLSFLPVGRWPFGDRLMTPTSKGSKRPRNLRAESAAWRSPPLGSLIGCTRDESSRTTKAASPSDLVTARMGVQQSGVIDRLSAGQQSAPGHGSAPDSTELRPRGLVRRVDALPPGREVLREGGCLEVGVQGGSTPLHPSNDRPRLRRPAPPMAPSGHEDGSGRQDQNTCEQRLTQQRLSRHDGCRTRNNPGWGGGG